MTRLFLISLGVTCLACVILFLYFRHRISRMEQKVDLMFQLIQEYEQNKNITYQQSVNEPANTVPYMTQEGGHRNDDDLISVSDDDRDLDIIMYSFELDKIVLLAQVPQFSKYIDINLGDFSLRDLKRDYQYKMEECDFIVGLIFDVIRSQI